jgi:hypothetical protein
VNGLDGSPHSCVKLIEELDDGAGLGKVSRMQVMIGRLACTPRVDYFCELIAKAHIGGPEVPHRFRLPLRGTVTVGPAPSLPEA